MIVVQLIILLAMILIGSRLKGIGLGVMGMVGLLIFIFIFHMHPTEPPLDVMLIIMAVVTTGAAMQAAGGLDYLVNIAERIIRSNPARVTLYAPFTVFFLCLFAGTSHIVYSVLPIIAEVSAKKRIRPERPMSISIIASHIALTGSPMSACTAALAGILAYAGAAGDIMKICIPACLIGVLAGAISVWKMGKELHEDPEFLEKMKDPMFAASVDAGEAGIKKSVKPGAKTAVFIFGMTILLVVMFGIFPGLIPITHAGAANMMINADATLKMPTVIILLALSATAIIILATKTKTVEVAKSSLFTAMGTASICVFGVVWMSSTFIANNQDVITHIFGDIAKQYPWTFAIAIFIMGAFIFSQAGTTKTMMPLAITLGIASPALIAMFPAVNSDFVLPGYPTLLAAVDFDRTGTTKIGKNILNHSFLRPGIVAIVVAIAAGFALEAFLMK
ncbi:MAG TPA: anaerobic C4-dicarboxylate transporter family protein [Chitinophagaceae bacterium]|nr:anaerobic C4-dicarboxylate transporter family protein [Chitinophagaceae bacterium]